MTSVCTQEVLPVIHLGRLVPGKGRTVQNLTLLLLPGNSKNSGMCSDGTCLRNQLQTQAETITRKCSTIQCNDTCLRNQIQTQAETITKSVRQYNAKALV